jgi:hypothetical protein
MRLTLDMSARWMPHPKSLGYKASGKDSAMNDMGRSEKTETSPIPGWRLGQVALEATQEFFNWNEHIVKTLTDLNIDGAGFVGQRLSQGTEAIGRMAQCRNFPEFFQVETQWFQTAVDDYSKRVSKLMEVNSKLVSSLVASEEQAGPGSSPLQRSMRGAG